MKYKEAHLFTVFLLLLSLKVFTQNTKLILPATQGINIRSASFSPDAKYFVTTQDKTIKIWEALTGKVIKNIQYKSDYAIYSHHSRYILTDDGKVWDVKKGTSIFSTDEKGCDFSKDDRYLLTTRENKINIHDLNTGLVNQIEAPGGRIARWAFFSPDQKNILAWNDNEITVWNISQKKMITHFNESSYVRWASFSPDGLHIVTSTVDSVIKIWDAISGKLQKTLHGHSGIVATVSYSPDGRDIVSASYDKTMRIWDAYSGKIKFTITAHTDRVNSAFYSADGKWIISSSWDKSVKVWERATGKLYGNYMGSINLITNAMYSANGKKLAILTDSCVKVCDPGSMEILKSFNEGNGFRQQVELTADGKFLITKGAVSYSPIVWNVFTGKREKIIPGFDSWISHLNYSADGKYFATSVVSGNTISIWEVQSSTKIQEIEKAKNLYSLAFDKNNDVLFSAGEEILLVDKANGNTLKKYVSIKDSTIHALKYSSDFRFILSASARQAVILDAEADSVIKVFDDPLARYESAFFSQDRLLVRSADSLEIRSIADGNLLHKIKYNDSIFLSPSLTPDQHFIMSVGVDNSLKFWDVNTGKHAWSYFVLFSTDFLTLLNGQDEIGYYYGTKSAVKELAFEINGKRYPFEQLDVKYNRPDKVLQGIGSIDTMLIKSYRRAWEKRIKKLGIDTTAFRDTYSVIDADFANRNNIPYEQKSNRLKLHIKGIDSTYKLDRFNVWLNEVPVFGQRGISIRKNNRNYIDTTITINLSVGNNQLETSVTDVNGMESYRLPLRVNYTPAVKKEAKTYFIGIGIDQFSDNKYNLKYSVKDIRDLSKKLKQKYGNEIVIDTLFNKDVTIGNVKALKKKLQQTSVNDKVIISYSGHGMLSKDFDYYLSTYAVNFDKPEENGLPYDEL
ncbi:MAG: caspase family protein, partial [Ferruginibacter sp.]